MNYSVNPEKLSIEIKDFLHKDKLGNRPKNSMEVYLSELGDESSQAVQLAMEKIYNSNRKKTRYAQSKQFGMEFLLRGIFIQKGLLFLHTEIKNTTDIPFDIDYLVFKIVDKKVAKRTAIQETIIEPVRAYNYITSIKEKESESTVFAFKKFTIPDKKQLVVELFEKDGGRNQRFVIKNGELAKARTTKKIQ